VIRNAGIHRTGVRSSLSGGRSRLEPARGVGRALAAALALIAARPLPPPAAAELAGPLVAMEQADGGPAALATPVALADSTAGPPADTVIVVPPQSLDGLPIGAIEIEPHTIYDPVPAGRLESLRNRGFAGAVEAQHAPCPGLGAAEQALERRRLEHTRPELLKLSGRSGQRASCCPRASSRSAPATR